MLVSGLSLFDYVHQEGVLHRQYAIIEIQESTPSGTNTPYVPL